MLTGLASYLFGLNEYSDEALENLFKETPVKGSDGDDWILVELKQPKSDLSADSIEQSLEADTGSLTSSKICDLPEKGSEYGIRAQDSSSDGESTNKENDSDNKLLTASNFPTTATSDDSDDKKDEEEDEDDEDDEDDDRDDEEGEGMFGDNINARNQETANKRKKRKSRDNNNSGTMEGSWFVTPPPCFVSHKKSSKKVSASPLEDILIEYPSISVFHSHTSSLDSFYPLPSTSSLSPHTTITSDSSSSPLSLVSPSSCTSNESNHQKDPIADQCLATRRIIDTVSIIAVTVEKLARMTSGASKGSNRSNRGHHNGSSSNSNENNNVEVNLRQPPRGAEARGAPIENHERNAGYLSDITNHHLAPMQKAINQGSQKYLKKSFLNRQNLVKFQSNRRPTRRNRCTQRPSGYSNNRKMC